MITVVLPAAMAFAVAWIVVRIIRRTAARLSLIDSPNARSSHRSPTPRGGGVGIVLGSVAGASAAVLAGAETSRSVAVVLAGAVTVAIVGLVDDVRRLPPPARLAVHAAAAVAVVSYVGPFRTLPLPTPLALAPPLSVAWVLSVVWICAVTNFFNFMDGIDGLAGGQAVASLFAVILAAWSTGASLVAVCVAAATLAFLIENWAPARIFMGDVGSGFLGFLLATLPLMADVSERGNAVLAAAIGMTLFLADPSETLVRRLAAGAAVTQAHREHAYQRFVGVGESAGRVSALLVASGFALAILGIAAYRYPSLRWVAVVAAACAYLVERSLSKRHYRRLGVVEPAR